VRGCKEVQEALPDYVYDIPTQWESEEISAHLHTCRECSRLYDELVSQFSLLDAWEVGEPEPYGYERFLEALAQRGEEEPEPQMLPAVVEVGASARERSGHTRWAGWAGGGRHGPRLAASVGVLATAALLVALLVVPAGRHAVAGRAESEKRQYVETLIAQGQLAEATRVCEAWTLEAPDSTTPHLLLSTIHERRGDWPQARRALQAVVALSPVSATAYLRLGDIARKERNFSEARQQYHNTVAIADRYLEAAYSGLSSTALETDQLNEARLYVDMALRTAPAKPEALALAGEIARRSGDGAEARRRFRQALQRDPRCADALWGMAALSFEKEGQTQAAVMYARRFLRQESGSPRARDLQARLDRALAQRKKR